MNLVAINAGTFDRVKYCSESRIAVFRPRSRQLDHEAGQIVRRAYKVAGQTTGSLSSRRRKLFIKEAVNGLPASDGLKILATG